MISKCLVFIAFLYTVPFIWANQLLIVTEEWPPYNFRNNGQIVGAATEIVKKVLAHTDYNYKLNLYPWARSYEIALKKPNVMIYTILRTPDREKLFKWVGPIFSGKQFYLYKLKIRKDIVVSNINDASKYSIGIMRGDVSHQFFNLINITSKNGLNISNSEEINIEKLFKSKVGLISGNSVSLPIRLKKLGYNYSDIEPTIKTFKYDYYMAMSRQTSNVIYNRINRAYNDISNPSLIKKLIKKYDISP